MHTFLTNLPSNALRGMTAAAFDTRINIFVSGSAAKPMIKLLRKAGAEMVLPPHWFYVRHTEGPLADGELAMAVQWGKQLSEQLLAEPQMMG